MDKPTNYEPSASATKPQDQAIHLDGPVVLSHAEIIAKQLELYAKRLRFNAKQLELDEQQRKLDDEQRELNGQSSVSVAFKLMVSASTRTPALPVVDAPTENPTMPAESTSPCPPIAALPSLLVAALPAARPTTAQEGKRPAPTNESAESPIAPKRHRGDGQISNNGATSDLSLTTCRSLSEQVAIERLVAALDIPALVAPAAGTSTFGDAPAAGTSTFGDAPAAGTSTFGDAPAAGALATNISALVAPAAGAPTFGDAPAAGTLAGDYSAFATGAPIFGNVPAIGVSAADISALDPPAAGATIFGNAPATGAPIFGVDPAAGILDRDVSDLIAPAAGATILGDAPGTGILDRDIWAYFSPATGAPTFGNTPAVGTLTADYSDFATRAPTFGVAPAIGVPDLNISDLVAPAIGVSAADISAYFDPAAGATTFGVAPAAGVLDRDISALVTPAAGASTFGNAHAVGIPALDMHVGNRSTVADTSHTFSDVSGGLVTSERLLVVFGASPYISLGYALDAYRYIYGCELLPRTLPSQYCIATLARVVALEHWAPHLEGEDPAEVADLNILCRRDLEIGALRQSFRKQLGLAQDSNAAVLGPRLCYVLARMCSMSVDLLTGPILRSMFVEVTGLDLHSLNVITEKGVRQMEAESIFHMVETRVGSLGKFIADDGKGLKSALAMVTDCNALFETRCDSASSSDASIALYMLRNNELYSTLFLGNRDAKWEALFGCLIFVACKNASPRTKECLEQLSKSLQIQPGSF